MAIQPFPRRKADRNARGQFLVGHTGIGGRPRGARNKLGEAFLHDLHADWEKQGGRSSSV
jgi:hypothetical protein